jgi:hypothetical protein
MTSSFIYEDLVSHVEVIRNQMFECEKILNNRWNDKKRKRDELKSRSLVFIDPYGNQKVSRHMDHELIINILNKYKEDYVPKYLQQWIKIGFKNENKISLFDDQKYKSIVADYTNVFQVFTYGLVTVRIATEKDSHLRQLTLPVLLMDTMEKIKLQLQTCFEFTDLELKLWKENENAEDKKEIRTILKSDDTIMSCQLYQDNCFLMAKVINCKVSIKTLIKNRSGIFQIFVLSLNGRTRTFRVYSSMKVSTLKALIEQVGGIRPDQQRLLYGGKQLEDERILADYKIEKEATIHLILRLRGGMYHFTSGRQDFNNLPYDGVQAIQNALAFQIKPMNQIYFLSSTELQNFVLQAQRILSNLSNTIGEKLVLDNHPK